MDTKFNITIPVPKETDLIDICSNIATKLPHQIIIGLSGDMGSGKTTFVRYLSAALGSTDWVNSPTYSIVQTYLATNHTIVHADLYRCHSEAEIDQLDLLSLYNQSTVFLIEWIMQSSITPDLWLNFSNANANYSIEFLSDTQEWITQLNHTNAQ